MTAVCSTCPYCGVGCGVSISADADEAAERTIVGDAEHPSNQGKLCIKGTNLAATLVPEGRLTSPFVGSSRASWDAAIRAVAQGFKETVDRYGPDSVAFYLSGQLLTEDYYVANKLMKGYIGSANVDTNSRLCMSSAVVAHKRAFGEDVVPCDYDDLEKCDLVVLVGSNAAWAHPVLYQRIEARRMTGQLKVVVIDPRRTQTAEGADIFLQINPGSDVALFNGLLTYLHTHDCCDRDFVDKATDGFDAALVSAGRDAAGASSVCGVSCDDLRAFYQTFARSERTVTLFSQGVNQSVQGVDKGNAIINCHLATGRIGKPGSGPFSITGQPNAMGGREVGGLANQLAAHMDFDPVSVDRVGRFWGTDCVARKPGLKAVEMFDALHEGQIKAIWIMGTNPAASLPNLAAVRRGLRECPLVVMSDCIAETDTAQFADIRLPALGWGEKDGTVTNSERVVSRQRGFLSGPELARADWDVICAVAREMGFEDGFGYTHPSEIFAEHTALTAFENEGERCLNLSHLTTSDRAQYDALAPSRWPFGRKPFNDRQFSTKNRRAQFLPVEVKEPASLPEREGDLVMNTGRLRDQWHTMTRTGLVPQLFQRDWLPSLDIHPTDAQRLEIEDGDLVSVRNAQDEISLIAQFTDQVCPGQVFAPIHWTDQFSGQACVGTLVNPVVDPLSGQPESKHTIVQVTRVSVAEWVSVVAEDRRHTELMLESARVKFWARVPAENVSYLLLGLSEPNVAESLLSSDEIVTYRDKSLRRVLGRWHGEEVWLLHAGSDWRKLPGAQRLERLFDRDVPDWQKLSSFDGKSPDSSPLVCSCYEVSRDKIGDAITQGCRTIEELGQALKCGTNCGSCRPDVQTILNEYQHLRPGAASHG